MCLSAKFVKALVVLSAFVVGVVVVTTPTVTPSGVAAFCPTAVTISGTGAYWNVGTLAEPRFTG